MSLPAPTLDDRTFQDLVDEAKRYVQQACPTWTNHNVSDPGVTLIETFAWMTDLMLYRLNRVPERNYLKFLDLLGITLFPPTSARTDVTFRLSTSQDTEVRIAPGTVVSTRRTATERAISFTTLDELVVVPARSQVVASMTADADGLTKHTMGPGRAAFTPFAEKPQPDDALYVGLSLPAPANLVLLQFRCEVGGHGIDPRNPPLVWEAYTGEDWERCDVERDTTRGLNASGSIELSLPRRHEIVSVGEDASAWLRCRVVSRKNVRPYRSSPRILSVSAATVGGYVEGLHAERILEETLGDSGGVPGQSFFLRNTPVVLSAEPVSLEIGLPGAGAPDGASFSLPAVVGPTSAALPSRHDGAGPEGLTWQPWTQVPNFADSGPDDRHFTVDATTGEVRFGPAVRQPDGTVRRYGAVPPKGGVLRAGYVYGGGRTGNVSARSLTILRTSIPYVASVYNRNAAAGGVDGETVAEAKVRAPLALRTRNRAVTTQDYEQLAREVAPDVARVRCVPVTDGGGAGLRLLVVPSVATDNGRVGLAQLIPDASTGERIRDYLDARRPAGVRLSIEPPSYVGTTVVARVRARRGADPEKVGAAALDALYAYFNPVTGGPDGSGWPFSRPVQVGETFAVLQRVEGVDYVEESLLFQANPLKGDRVGPQERIDLEPTNLVLSYEHEVLVEPAVGDD